MTQPFERVEKHQTYKIVLRNFIGGMAWGIGSVLGATVVISILVGVLSFFDFLPVVGNTLKFIENEVDNKKVMPAMQVEPVK